MKRCALISFALLALLAGCATANSKKEAEAPKTPEEVLAAKAEELRASVESDPGNVELHYRYGNALFDLQKYPEAQAQYESAIDLQPSFAAAHCNLGLALRLQGLYDEAIKSYQTALQYEPDDVATLSNLIAAMRASGKLDEILEPLRHLAELKKDDVEVLSELANMLLRRRQYEEAIPVYQKIIQLDPGLAGDFYNLGLCYFSLDKLDTALTTWLTALAHDADNASARKGIAVIYWRKDEYDAAWKAVADCEKRGLTLDADFLERLREDSGKLGPGS